MAQYHNRGTGPLAIALRSGKSAAIPGKAWVEIPAAEEGSEELIRALKQGFLYRFDPGPEEGQKAEEVRPAEVIPSVVEAAPETAPEPSDASVEDSKVDDDRAVLSSKFSAKERSKKG